MMNSIILLYYFSVCLLLSVPRRALCVENDFKGFDDSILFGINWPGAPDLLEDPADTNLLPENNNFLTVTTVNKESYKCHLPDVHKKEALNMEEYDGPSPISLLQPLFIQKICSYRLETYWSYEMCHGRYIRQYHEEREGKQVKTQEFFLGHYNGEKESKSTNEEQDKKLPLKTTQVEGMTLPYVEIAMDDGTICDLNGKARLTRVLYVCYSHGKHEVYSFKETSTCEYEVIILTPLLCQHPHFMPKEKNENIIDCIPLGDAPTKPRNLLKSEIESLKFQQQSAKHMIDDDHTKDVLAVLKVEKMGQETQLKLELRPLNEEDLEEGADMPSMLADRPQPISDRPPPITDDSPVRAFLNGENCLSGGTGWWKYEFCYGQHVMQYHVDRAGEKTTLLLGKFNEEAHINWVKENLGRAPQPIEKRTSISHFYSDGDICDKTDRPRQTEVKLKCVKNSSSASQVSLYLLEPRTCHYILGVESPLICDILPHVDEYGLVRTPKPLEEAAQQVEDKNESVDEIREPDVNKFGFD